MLIKPLFESYFIKPVHSANYSVFLWMYDFVPTVLLCCTFLISIFAGVWAHLLLRQQNASSGLNAALAWTKPGHAFSSSFCSPNMRISCSCQYQKSNGCPWTLLYGSLLEYYGKVKVMKLYRLHSNKRANSFHCISQICCRVRRKTGQGFCKLLWRYLRKQACNSLFPDII